MTDTELARKIRESPPGLGRKELYSLYLKTHHWKIKRNRAERRAKFICEICKNAPVSDVHHLTYERIGCERRSDIIAICRDCHIREHFGIRSITHEEWKKRKESEKRLRAKRREERRRNTQDKTDRDLLNERLKHQFYQQFSDKS